MHKGLQLGGRTLACRASGKVSRAAPFWVRIANGTSGRGLTPASRKTSSRINWTCPLVREANQSVPSSRYIASLVAYAAGQAFRPLALLADQARCHKGAGRGPFPLRGKRQSSLCLPREASVGALSQFVEGSD